MKSEMCGLKSEVSQLQISEEELLESEESKDDSSDYSDSSESNSIEPCEITDSTETKSILPMPELVAHRNDVKQIGLPDEVRPVIQPQGKVVFS